MKRIIVIALLTFAGTLYSQWSDISIKLPGQVNFFTKSGTGKVFAATDVGVYSSTDFGGNWVNCNTGIALNTNITCMASKDSVIMIGTFGSGIYRSRDNGNIWEHITVYSTYNDYVESIMFKDNYIMAGCQSNLYKSTNGGNNWVVCQFGYFIMSVSSLTFNNYYIFAATKVGSSGTVYRSSNDGTTWEPANNGLSTFGTWHITSCGEKLFGILIGQGYCYTTNNGNNWVEISGCGMPWYNCIGHSDNFVFMGGYGSLSLISNCNNIITLNLSTKNVNDCLISYPDVIIATDSGIYKSNDGGYNWHPSNKGYMNIDYKGVGAYGSTIFTAAYCLGAIYKSNMGANWTKTNGILGLSKPHYFSYSNTLFFAFTEDILLKVDYNLTSWSPVNFMSYIPKTFDAYDNLIVASNSSNIVYKSINGCNDWTSLGNNGLPNNIIKITKTIITPNFTVLIILKTANNDNKLYRMVNNGSAWQESSLPGIDYTYLSLIKRASGIVYGYAANSGVYVSTNNGVNWIYRNQGLPADSINDFCGENNIVCCATSNNGVYKSTDAGITWTGFNQNLGNMKVNALSCYFGEVYAATDSGLYKTDMTVGIKKDDEIVKNYYMYQNYPNPFNPSTNIKYALPHQCDVTIKIFDINGREIKTMVRKGESRGMHIFEFDGSGLSSGIYFCKMQAGDFVKVSRMVLIK